VNSAIVLSKSCDRVGLFKELDRQNCGQAAKDIEVIPFDDVSHRRSDNHAAEIALDLNCHVRLPLFQGIASNFSALYFFAVHGSCPTFIGANCECVRNA
jgi:hypothetical protein